MSYEGSTEWLCSNGHYSQRDCHDEHLKACPDCNSAMAFWHMIDETNGEDDDLPCTKPAPKQQIGYDDVWRVDHYGNRYAVKNPRFAPGAEWSKTPQSDTAGQ